jgi:hypothetical protein
MPSLIYPVFPVIRMENLPSKNENDYDKKAKNEFQIVAEFFYSIDIKTSEEYSSKMIKEEFIVYIKKSPKSIILEFYYLNGEFMCSKTFERTQFGTNNVPPNVFDFKLSKNGRYLLVYKAYKNHQYNENQYWSKIEANVYEIVLLSTMDRKIFLRDHIMNPKHNKVKSLANLPRFIRKNVFPGIS